MPASLKEDLAQISASMGGVETSVVLAQLVALWKAHGFVGFRSSKSIFLRSLVENCERSVARSVRSFPLRTPKKWILSEGEFVTVDFVNFGMCM